MTTSNQQAQVILHAALSFDDPARRTEYLDAACRDNSELREQVESLLNAHENAGEFMASVAASSSLADELDQPSESIGRYKLLQQIGEGGFGIVYMAEQQEPVLRRVALKVIKPGMDTKQVIGRFEAERQALALLDHPNIAKVLDAGATEQGRPFFVMELVRGEPITNFCDAKQLNATQRLELFIEVCHAIQHAHQKGIIHRDIKPSNVLVATVDDRPVAKVIDFGIAKATQQRLTERTLFTDFRQFIGTPAYMSPEQASPSGADIDTRSDVYSLGVLLYELLAGVPPFDEQQLRAMGYDELCRVIRESVPPTPSNRVSTLGGETAQGKDRGAELQSLQARLRGEVDWIVMKALEKDRARRYETANAFADDIQRYLHHEPVLAGPPSSLYRLQKFAQRNRAATLSVLAIAASLLIGTLAALVGLSHALDSLEEARIQTDRAVAAEADRQQQAEALAVSEARLRRNLYATEMITTKREFDQSSLVYTIESLEKYIPRDGKPDLRGFEWRWLWNQCHLESFQFTGGPINANTVDGGPLTRDMVFSPDGKWLTSGATDGFVRLWDVTNRTHVWSFKGGVHCNAVDISPDGRLLLANFYMPIDQLGTRVWDISDPNSPVEFKRLKPGGTRFLPDGQSVVDAFGGEYDFAGKQLRSSYILSPGSNGQMWARHYSKDRKTLATHNRVWDVPSGRQTAQLPLVEGFLDVGPVGVAISPLDNNFIARGSPVGVQFWDRDGNQLGEIPDTNGTPIGWLSFSADGKRLAIREFMGAVRVFETEDWRELVRFPIAYPDSSVLFSPVDNNLLLARGSDGVIRGFSVSTADIPDVSFDHSAEILSMKFSPDGRFLAAGAADGSVLFWDVIARTKAYTTSATCEVKQGQLRFYNSLSPDYVAFSPDSLYAAIAGTRTLFVRDLKSWDVVAQWTIPSDEIPDGAPTRTYWAVCFSDDGKQLFASNYRNQRIDVWDWPNRGAEFRPKRFISTKAKSLDAADGMLGSISFPSTELWKLPELTPLKTVVAYPNSGLESEDGGGVNLAFSPDEKRLAICSSGVRIVNLETQEVEAKLPHSFIVEHASWSPDGNRIASSDIHATTILWDVKSQRMVANYQGSISAFSPDGTILAVGAQGSKYSGDTKHLNRVTLYSAPTLTEIDRTIANSKDD